MHALELSRHFFFSFTAFHPLGKQYVNHGFDQSSPRCMTHAVTTKADMNHKLSEQCLLWKHNWPWAPAFEDLELKLKCLQKFFFSFCS